jgi:hypothetical protein
MWRVRILLSSLLRFFIPFELLVAKFVWLTVNRATGNAAFRPKALHRGDS